MTVNINDLYIIILIKHVNQRDIKMRKYYYSKIVYLIDTTSSIKMTILRSYLI